MRKVLGLLVIAFTAIVLVGCAKQKEFDFDKGYITVGLEADYLPFNWPETEANDYNHPLVGGGFVAGYDVDMAKLIAKSLNLELRIKKISWDSLTPALNLGDIDLIIAGMSPTEERKEVIDFTNSYYTSNHVVVVSKTGNYTGLTSLDDLNGAKGQGQKGTIYATLVDYVKDNHGSTSLPVANTVPLIANTIKYGAADFTVVEKPVAMGLIAAFPNDLQIELDVEENIFNVSDEDREIAIGIRKVDTILKEKINTALAGISTLQRDQIMNQAVIRSAVSE